MIQENCCALCGGNGHAGSLCQLSSALWLSCVVVVGRWRSCARGSTRTSSTTRWSCWTFVQTSSPWPRTTWAPRASSSSWSTAAAAWVVPTLAVWKWAVIYLYLLVFFIYLFVCVVIYLHIDCSVNGVRFTVLEAGKQTCQHAIMDYCLLSEHPVSAHLQCCTVSYYGLLCWYRVTSKHTHLRLPICTISTVSLWQGSRAKTAVLYNTAVFSKAPLSGSDNGAWIQQLVWSVCVPMPSACWAGHWWACDAPHRAAGRWLTTTTSHGGCAARDTAVRAGLLKSWVTLLIISVSLLASFQPKEMTWSLERMSHISVELHLDI